MRIRAQSSDGDMQFGNSGADFYVNDKRGVAQNVQTRLGLYVRDWALATDAGTPWRTQVLGKRTDATRDPAIRARILSTPGVTGITSFASQLDRETRGYAAQVAISTVYGQTIVSLAGNGPNGDVRNSR